MNKNKNGENKFFFVAFLAIQCSDNLNVDGLCAKNTLKHCVRQQANQSVINLRDWHPHKPSKFETILF